MTELDSVQELYVDTESNGQSIKDGRGYGIGISICFSYDGLNGYSYYFPFRHQQGNLNRSYLAELTQLIENPKKKIVSHHRRFDIMSEETLGIKNHHMDFECTMLMAHSVNENMFSYSLDHLAKQLGFEGKAKDKHWEQAIKLLGWDGMPPSHMGPYAATDSYLLYPIYQHYKEIYDAEDDSNGELWENDKKFMLVLNSIEKLGARVDLELAEREIERGEGRMQEITKELKLNPGSNSQLKILLIDQLGLPVLKASPKTGKPSFDKATMERYEDEYLSVMDNPVAQRVLEYRGYQKAVSSYWRSYIEHVSPDGRIRTNFNLHRTRTHRLSSDEPNLQQIPKVTEKPWNKLVKSGFLPEDGYEIWEADYSQLEMRLTAAYAKQTDLIEIFEDDTRDLFDEMSKRLGLPRDHTKTLNYAIGYGAGIGKVAAMLGVSQAQAKFIRDDYFNTYSGFRQVSQLAATTCKGQGFVRTWSTRRRHFENPYEEAHKAFNSVIQGGAADIVKRVMIRLFEELDPECRMILQVHDSVWFEIPKGKIEKYRKEIVRIMEDVRPNFGVRFKVDFHKLSG